MSEWIKKIKDDEITQLARDDYVLDDVPSDIDGVIVRTIRAGKPASRKRKIGKRTYVPYLLAAAIIILSAIPVTYFIMQYIHVMASTVTLVAGNGEIIRGDRIYPLQTRDNLVRGDSISIEDHSTCMIQIGEKILVKVFEKSKMTLGEILSERVVLYLDYGRMLVNTEKASERTTIEVRQENSVLYAGRSTYYIEYNDDGTIIASRKGGGKITDSEANKDYPVHEQSYTLIKKDESPLRSPLTREMEVLIKKFTLNETIKNVRKAATLTVNTSLDSVILTIDNRLIEEFSQSISLTIEPGSYFVEFKKEGFIPYREEIDLEPGRTHIFAIKLIREREKQKAIRLLGPEKIYTHAIKDESFIPEIKGFSLSQNCAVAFTGNSLICFNTEGSFLWKREYGRDDGLLFDSLPIEAVSQPRFFK
jgi:hypothetical protein